MRYKKLISLIKESIKGSKLPPGYPLVPLVNYTPPGVPIIINPILNTANVPQGPKPADQETK